MRTLRRIVGRHSQSEGLLQWKFSGPLSRKNRLPAALARELTTAKRLDLIAAYFSPPWSFMRRLGRIARRGQARVITAALSDNNATIAAARHTYSRLLRRGVQMFEYRAAKLHTKLAIVDDVVHVGSANLDFRSLFINMEIVLRVDDAGFRRRDARLFRARTASLRAHHARAAPATRNPVATTEVDDFVLAGDVDGLHGHPAPELHRALTARVIRFSRPASSRPRTESPAGH